MMGGEQFNYAQFSTEVRGKLGELETIILEGERRLTCSVAIMGGALVEAKQFFPHGMFLCWCRLVLGIEPRRAQLYMNVARLYEKYGKDVCLLPLTAAQDLGSSSVREETVHEVLARVRRGERVTVDWVQSTIRRDRGSSSKTPNDNARSIEIATMIADQLDVNHCQLLHAFIEERPSAREFMANLADLAAAKIHRGRSARVTPVILSLPMS